MVDLDQQVLGQRLLPAEHVVEHSHLSGGYARVREPLRLAPERRRPATAVITALGRLHLDHAGAEVAEHHAGVRSGEGAGWIDDRDVGEQLPHRESDPSPQVRFGALR
jgi:hypothetical protein